MNKKLLSGGGCGKRGFLGTGGGATTFLALTDTPASYVGQAAKVLRVNGAETAVEFIAPPAPPIDNPKIWYKGDNCPLESVGTLNMLYGGGLTPVYATGNYGRAFDISFNRPGDADFFQMSVANNSKFNFVNTDDFTVKLWVKITGAATAFFPISKGSVAASYSENWGIYISGNFPAPGYLIYLSLPVVFNLNTGLAIQNNDWNEITWYHYATGINKIRLNCDAGSEYTSGVVGIGNTAVSLRLGCGWFGNCAAFLDDVKIYDGIDLKP